MSTVALPDVVGALFGRLEIEPEAQATLDVAIEHFGVGLDLAGEAEGFLAQRESLGQNRLVHARAACPSCLRGRTASA
jgi:hypothetical protein